jgi:hypothetical protein
MPEYLVPGTYTEEKAGPRPIEGVGTAVAAFIGFAPAGPANEPRLITNCSQLVVAVKAPSGGSFKPGRYSLKITPLDANGKLAGNPYEASNFFEHIDAVNAKNGYVTIEVHADFAGLPPEERIPRIHTYPIAAGVPGTGVRQINIVNVARKAVLFTVTAPADPNAPALKIEVKEEAPPQTIQAAEDRFSLEVKMAGGDVIEHIRDVSLGKRGNVEEAVARQSRLVRVKIADGAAPTEKLKEGQQIVLPAPKIDDLKVETAHITGENDGRAGIAGLRLADDVTMVCCPDLMAAFDARMIDEDGVKRVQDAMIAHCENDYRRDRIAILDMPLSAVPQGAPMGPQEAKEWRMQVANFGSPFAALYYPWVTVLGPGDKKIAVPPCGHIAGIWARNDRERGVHKAPANEEIRGIVGVAVPLSAEDQAGLNPEGVNCLRSFPGRGVRVWGARTMSSDPQWKYINVRRLFNYIEKSIERSMQWVVFEPNDYDLWARVKRDISAFLTSTWRQGMLFGANPQDAFFVVCDARNNPAEERDQGRLFVDIGLAPSKPAEFVVFRYTQKTEGGE